MALPDYFSELAARVRNWGRWGPDDELGTLNLIDDEVVRRGVDEARTGRCHSLAVPLCRDGIQMGWIPGRTNPDLTLHSVNEPLGPDPDAACSNDDHVTMGLQAGTHWDALSHVSYAGRIYNGYAATDITTAGTHRCGIHRVRSLVGRGILLDVARASGVDRLPGGYPLTAEDLDRAEEWGKVAVRPGDVVLIRTGQMAFLNQDPPDRVAYAISTPGLSLATVPWMREHDVAAVATDTMVCEVYPWEDPDLVMPVHLVQLVDMGLTQGQNWSLDALAEDCAEDGRYAFLLSASPEPFVGAVGSPVNPVAIK